MKRALLWIAPIFLCACHYQVFVNKKPVYSGPRISPDWLKANDSFMVVGKSEPMPDSAILIEKTVAVEHSLGYAGYDPENDHALIDVLKPEAKIMGANLIRIVRAERALSPASITAWLYYVNKSCKSRYIHQLDSIRHSHPDSTIVHVVNLILRDTIRIYFRDTLIGYCPAPARERRPLLIEACTFTFPGSGHLGFGNPRPYGWYLQKTPLTKGKEYFVFIYFAGGRQKQRDFFLTERSYYW